MSPSSWQHRQVTLAAARRSYPQNVCKSPPPLPSAALSTALPPSPPLRQLADMLVHIAGTTSDQLNALTSVILARPRVFLNTSSWRAAYEPTIRVGELTHWTTSFFQVHGLVFLKFATIYHA